MGEWERGRKREREGGKGYGKEGVDIEEREVEENSVLREG